MLTVPMFIIFLLIGGYNLVLSEKISKVWFGAVWFTLLIYIIINGVRGGI